MWGENFDLSNANGWLGASDADLAGITAIRFAMRVDTPLDLVAAYQAHGSFPLGILDKTSYDDHVWVPELDAYQIGNEPDVAGKASWTMAAADYMALVKQYRADHPHAHLILAGMASGSTAYFRSVQGVWDQVDGYAVHLYGGSWVHARTILRTFRQYAEPAGLPTYVTEWDPASDRPAVAMPAWHRMLQVEAHLAFHFCLNDAMVAPFGLYDATGIQKPQYRAIAGTR
jgi:Glycosyl hydrolase catalytic core